MLTQSDLVGLLEHFPIEVVKRMLECQIDQGNKEDVTIFQNHLFLDSMLGGFSWDATIEGYNFWHKILIEQDFDIFFDRYPKDSFPKRMLVSHRDDISSAKTRIVIAKKQHLYVAWADANTFEEAENVFDTSTWEYAWDYVE